MIQTKQSMTFHTSHPGPVPAAVSISRFRGEGGVEEYHLAVRPTEYASAATQLDWVSDAYQRALASMGLDAGTSVFRRFFCSDLVNQVGLLKTCPLANSYDPDDLCAASWAGQPPAPPAKIALWAYHVSDPAGALDKSMSGASLALDRGELAHLWTAGVTSGDGGTCYSQTHGILNDYEAVLQPLGMRLADHVVRTWFFVQNIDAEYQGLVTARREVFAQRGMTAGTHFIASTGIGGATANVAARVAMDAYAISGVRPEQIRFLCAPDQLSPTHIYGVTFERGVSLAYRDRKHVLISGTASIDSEGLIVHPGDVLSQLDRTLENVEALLANAGATLQDACSFVTYVRDASDLEAVRLAMWDRLGPAPLLVVVAPVCRPGWLVEVECQAIVPDCSPDLAAF